MDKNKVNVPKIRFPEFDGAWEQRKFGEIATLINGRAYSQEELLSSGKYKVLRVGNFYTNDSWYYSNMELGEKYYANNGDLLYTWSATFGPHIWLGNKVIYHYHIWKIELSEQLEKQFAVQLLEQDKENILSNKNGSTMVHITKAGMEEKEVLIPSKLMEQAKIGVFFSKLDNLITLHQRKLEHLQDKKKGLLQKMFPKEEEKFPELRFSGFTDPWEQRKLGEYCEMYNGDRGINYPNERDMVSEGIPFINAGDLKNGRVNLSNANKITREKYSQLGGAKLQLGDIVYCLRGTLGKNAFIDNFDEGTVASSLVVLRPKDIDGKYLFHILNSDIEFRQRTVCDEGAAQPNLSAKSLGGFDIPIPKIEEQIKISGCLDKIDDIITLHKCKLEHLQQQKKGLLQQMFI